MRLLLIRHGETEHNVAGLLAGVTDSRLTNHGVLQTQRLAAHLLKTRNLCFTQIFASDLQRAFRTAKAISDCQNAAHKDANVSAVQLILLREQDFGSFELLPWNRSEDARQNDPSENDADFKPKETAVAMSKRAADFLDDYIIPLFAIEGEAEQVVATVSHGLFLAALWRTLLARFKPSTVALAPDAVPPGTNRPLGYLSSWTNTGFLELVIKTNEEPSTQDTEATKDDFASNWHPLSHASMTIMSVNSKEHLTNLKRARGGIGSSASDDKQGRLDTFFKKPKT